MKLTIIGSRGAYPAKNEASSGYLLQSDGFSLLLDCGSGILSKLPEYMDINDLEAVVISHFHPDHTADTGVLKHAVIVQKALGNRSSRLLFYAPEIEPWFSELNHEAHTEAVPYCDDKEYTIGPFRFSFVKAVHPVTAYSMRIECGESSLGYTGDTEWNDTLPDFFSGVDTVLSEASLFERFKGKVPGHLTALEAGQLAEQAEAKRLILTHFPHFGIPSDLKIEAEKSFSGSVELALEGHIWEI